MKISPQCQKMIDEAIKILTFEPAIMQYYSLCELRPVDNEKVTMRTNCRGTGSRCYIEYNPAWLEKITEPSVVAFLIYAEVLRVALHHVTTRKNFPLQALKLASDLVVYDEFRTVLSLQKEAVRQIIPLIPTRDKYKPILDKYKITEEDGFFLEKLFNVFRKEMQDQQQQQSHGGEGEGSEGEGQSGEGQGSNGKSQGKSQGKGKGKGKGDSNDKSQGKGKGTGSEMGDALQKHFENSAENAETQTEGWEENTSLDNETQHVTKAIAESGMSSTWGSISGGLKQMIMAANTPKFDPSTILKHFVGHIQSHDRYWTRMKANRRHGWEISGCRKKKMCRVLFAYDVSGSMSDDDVAIGMSFLGKFIKKADTNYCCWDGDCSEITKVRKNLKEYEIIGRGCTNPQCVIDKLNNDKERFDGIVFFTDCQFDWECPQKYVDKIFVIKTETGDDVPQWCRYSLDMKDIKEYEQN